MLKNAKAAVQTIAPGSTVLKKVMDKAKAAKGATDKPTLSVETVVESNGRAKMLAEEHWEFVRDLLETHVLMEPDFLKQVEFHYKSAMIHGYKHGVDDRERAIQS
jgi:hypothetical protein